MKRRDVLAAVLALGVQPASAQEPGRTYRVGLFISGPEPAMRGYLDAIRERLAQHGFVEGRNLQAAWKATANFNPVTDLEQARTLLASKPDAMLTFGTGVTRVVQQATQSVPIVFTFVGDAVAYGVVKEERRPGGNTTGVSMLQRDTNVKRLELLRELLPHAKRVAVVGYFGGGVDFAFHANEPHLRQAAERLGFELIMEPGWSEVGGFVPAMKQAAARGAEAIFVLHPLAILGYRFGGEDVVRAASEQRIPTVFFESELVAMGGLISYGASLVEEARRAADQLARVLKGAKAGELAVDQASRFELVVNMKTAKALGLTVPQSILIRADRVIE
jgi:putative ABC transport system substrate-binding protein